MRKVSFDGGDWLYFPAIAPRVAIIRATTADEAGNLSYEHEGALLGGIDQALAARNSGGIVIAQVKRVARSGTLRPQDVRMPCNLVDYIVVDADHLQCRFGFRPRKTRGAGAWQFALFRRLVDIGGTQRIGLDADLIDQRQSARRAGCEHQFRAADHLNR